MANGWTATSNTYWIHFSPARTNNDYTTAGTATQSIRVYIDESNNPEDSDTGTITISTDNGFSTKTIKRCIPNVEGEIVNFTFRVNGNNCDDGTCTVGPCGAGLENITASAPNNGSINITDISLEIKKTLSNGNTIPVFSQTDMPLSDFYVHYIAEGVDTTFVPKNDGDSRTLTIKLVWKEDTSIEKSVTVTQEGYYILPDHTNDASINESILVPDTSGYTSERYWYDFKLCVDDGGGSECETAYTASSCEGGRKQFIFKNNFDEQNSAAKVRSYGGFSAKTICGDVVYWGKSSSVTIDHLDIYDSGKVFWLLSPSAVYGKYVPPGNVEYYSNEDDENRVITVTARIKDTSINFDETSSCLLTIPSGDECKPKLHIILNNKYNDAIPSVGGVVTIEYCLANASNQPVDDKHCIYMRANSDLYKSDAITSISNYVYTRKIEIKENTGRGRNVPFTIDSNCGYEPVTIYIRQLGDGETLINDCDYFIYKLEWENSNGSDLDTLTKVVEDTGVVRADGYTNESLSDLTIGWRGTANRELPECVKVDGNYLIRHGGNSTYSGAENAIICLNNIKTAFSTQGLTYADVEIYTHWYETLGSKNGKFTFNFTQLNGKLDKQQGYSNFTQEISTANIYHGCIIYEGTSNTEKVNESSKALQTNSNGRQASELARLNPNSCLNQFYKHLYTLRYDFSENTPTGFGMALHSESVTPQNFNGIAFKYASVVDDNVTFNVPRTLKMKSNEAKTNVIVSGIYGKATPDGSSTAYKDVYFLQNPNTDYLQVGCCYYTDNGGNPKKVDCKEPCVGSVCPNLYYYLTDGQETTCEFKTEDNTLIGVSKIKAQKDGNNVILTFDMRALPSDANITNVDVDLRFVTNTNVFLNGCNYLIEDVDSYLIINQTR